jgi:para-aminobenzoate synthetase
VTTYQGHRPVKTIPNIDSFWTWLNDVQVVFQKRTKALNPDDLTNPESLNKATLQVGFIGQFGYEMKRESLPGYDWCSRIAKFGDQEAVRPDAQFMFAQDVLRFDHVTQLWTLLGLARNGEADPLAALLGVSCIGSTIKQFEEYGSLLKTSMNTLLRTKNPLATLPTLKGSHTESTYASLIAQIRSAIKEGDSYEMTLTTKFQAQVQKHDCFELYRGLRARNPAPYSAFLSFAATETTIMSSSPERFISIDRHGLAEMKPIKGTVAVSKDKKVDALIKEHLSTDVKELAENLMVSTLFQANIVRNANTRMQIVDLIRNDLHTISPTETIKVPNLMQIESYETVHQLVTTIQSKVKPEVGSVQAIQSIFPPGSMTGAPKLRSVKILDRLEHGQKRGVYSGCLGYICVSGAVDQSVVIRTIVRHKDNLELGAGGAITWLSDPTKEWDEVLIKARAVADVVVDQVKDREDSMEPELVTVLD